MKSKLLIRLTSLGLAVVTAFGMTACNKAETTESDSGSIGQNAVSSTVEKPEKITLTFDSCMTVDNGIDQVCDKYKELTGIELELKKPDHDQYYQSIALDFASGSESDVIEMNAANYAQYASEGKLWDMTRTWVNSLSPVKDSVDSSYIDALLLDQKLYGFPTVAGNGTVTYVRQDWLDEAGLEMPTNYDEFIGMLTAFKERGENIIPITAAGVLNNDAPCDIFLREFYQDAIPDFYKQDDGTWADGFSEEAMKQAMQRFQDAYGAGLIDPPVFTNKTESCRDKFKEGVVGAFNYWAGTWGMKLEDGTPGSKLSALPAIEEVKNSGGYKGRVPLAMVITSDCENPEGVFEHLILYSHDGGEGQKLFTYGVEGVHYTTNADGTITMAEQIKDPTKTVEKAFYAPEWCINTWDDPLNVDERVQESIDVYLQNRTLAKVTPASAVLTSNQEKIYQIRNDVLANVIHGNITVDEAMQKYETESAKIVEDILADLSK